MSLISSLYRLQQIDTQLEQAQQRLAQISEILAEQTELNAARARLQTAEGNLQQQRKLLRQAEIQVGDQKIKIQQTESTLYGGRVRNPKELQDLQNEVASLKRYLSVLEDRQLELMLGLEEAEAVHAQAQAEANQLQAQVIERNAGLQAEQNQLTQALGRLGIERQAAESPIPADTLGQYNQLRRSRHGVAVVQVTNRACAACGSGLSPAVIQSASQGAALVNCPMCGRLLYA